MKFIKGLKCRECGRHYPIAPIYVCEFCFGPLEVVYDYEKIKPCLTIKTITKRDYNIWRYKELLPLLNDTEKPASGHHTGFTPFFRAKNLEKLFKAKEIYIKDDSVNHPTLSFKDRVVAVALTVAREFGFKTVACASTGNLANAVASHSRTAGLRSYVFIPSNLEKSKILTSLIYGAQIVAIDGNYDDVNRLCGEIASRYKWGFVNVNLRPYYAEGSKTYGFEIIEQMGWKTPDNIVVPVASGSLLTKIHKGINELERIGIIKDSNKVKIYAAQAEGCSPVVQAIKEKSSVIKPVKPHTIAKSLAIGNPADGYYARDVVNASHGAGESVTDEEITEGIKILAETEGVFTETAGGVTVAVARKLLLRKKINPDESIVLCITGNGLKTQEAVSGILESPSPIRPTIADFERNFLKK